MKKDFIVDEGVVRRCDLNVSKMTLFELMYFRIFEWKYINKLLKSMVESIIEFFKDGIILLINLICLIFVPILFIVDSVRMIKSAKEVCKED